MRVIDTRFFALITATDAKISGYFGKAPPLVNRQQQGQLQTKLAGMIDLLPVDIIRSKGFCAVLEFLHPFCLAL